MTDYTLPAAYRNAKMFEWSADNVSFTYGGMWYNI